MLERVEIDSFQSIASANMVLGKFTVLVGPSNSGKSAVLRSLKLLAQNVTAPAYVTHGATRATVTATIDSQRVMVRRGINLSEFAIGEDRYPKAARGVPEAVSALLRLGDINFASQFDRPYLLDESGALVARVIGELTNVTRVYEAVREGNRRKLAASTELKLREIDLATAVEDLKGYVGLPLKLSRIAEVKKAVLKVSEKVTLQKALDYSVTRVSTAASAVDSLRQEVPEPPSVDKLLELEAFRNAVKLCIINISMDQGAVQELTGQVEVATTVEHELHDELHSKLVEAGVCPTCGQEVR